MRDIHVLHLAPRLTASGIGAYGALFRRSLELAGGVSATHCAPCAPRTTRGVRDFTRRTAAAAIDADVIHVELGGASLAEFYAARRLIADGHPVCLTLHEAPRPIWLPFHTEALRASRLTRVPLARLGRPFAGRLEREVVERASQLFTLTPSGLAAAAELWEGRALPPAEILPYPTGPRLAPRPARTDTPAVAFHGYWYRSKGLEVLVAALAQAEGVHARLFGDTLPAGGRVGRRYRQKIVREIARNSLEDRCRISGHLPTGAVHVTLAEFDAVVLPYTTSPRVTGLASTSAALWDARAAGVPVIASRVRGLPDHVTDGVDGLLVPPGDLAALAKALRQLRDPDLRASLRAGAQVAARQLDARAAGVLARDTYTRILQERGAERTAPRVPLGSL